MWSFEKEAKMITINIANEYTKTPGGRFKSEGDFSGEDFRDSILIPKYLEAVKQNQLLCINLDGGYGYGSSFWKKHLVGW